MAIGTLPLFNKLSSLIANAKPVAVYDLALRNDLRDEPAPTTKGLPPDLPTFYDVAENLEEFEYYEIPSSWTLSAPHAYYLRRKNGLYVDYPYSMGIPLTYGGAPRLRFKILSDKIKSEEPILAIPSFGLGSQIANAAQTFEFWINTEPYSAVVINDVLPSTITDVNGISNNFVVDSGNAFLRLNTTGPSTLAGENLLESEYYVIDLIETFGAFEGFFNNAFWTQTRAQPEFASSFSDQFFATTPEPATRDITIGGEKPQITFTDPFVVEPNQEYVFSLTVEAVHEVSTITVTLNYGEGQELQIIEFTDIPPTSAGLLYNAQFTSSNTVKVLETKMSIGASSTLTISNPRLANIDAPMESPSTENILLEIGGVGGASVRLSADPFYMYLRGYDSEDHYQVGEWARPMYVVCVDEKTKFSVYVNAFLVMSIEKKFTNVVFDSIVQGNWIVFYGSPLFKYIELGTVAVYAKILRADIQKYHHFLGFGTSYNEIIGQTEYNKMYIADGSATKFVSRFLFPKPHRFLEGSGTGVKIGNSIELKSYDPFEMPSSGMNFAGTEEQGYSQLYITFPHLAKFHIDKIAPDVSHIFIKVTTWEFHEGRICTISVPKTNSVCYFDLSQDPDNENNHIVTASVDFDGENSVWWTSTSSDLKEFVIGLDLDKLSEQSNPAPAFVFRNNNLVIEFSNEVHLVSIGAATRDIMLINNIPFDHPDGIAVTPDLGLAGKINYLGYVNSKIKKAGRAISEWFDVAATGYWTVAIPLANLITLVGGKPDLDFLMYFDQLQSPQLVSKLSTQYSTYDEVATYVDETLAGLVTDLAGNQGSYDDAQKYAEDSSIDSDPIPYKQIDVGVDASIPTLGRFEKNPVHTFVTLDSPTFWPYKDYTRLKTEFATLSGYIDFKNSSNSVTDTKWEIYDGFAIQIPQNIDLMRYNLRYAMHLTSHSMNTNKPSFNSMDLYGVSSGTNPVNAISTAFGNEIVVGAGDAANIERQYSTHFTALKVPAHMFSRELGFYPHGNTETSTVIPINYYLGNTEVVRGISMYFCWRAETFRAEGSLSETIGAIRYYSNVDSMHHIITLSVETDPDPNYTFQRGKFVLSKPTAAKIYVDGILDGPIEAGRWHLLHLTAMEDLDAPSTRIFAVDNRSMKFIHSNNKAVLNYVASHSTPVTPTSLYASRFGATDTEMFPLDPAPDDIFVNGFVDEGFLVILRRNVSSLTSGAIPTITVPIVLQENV